MSDLPFPQFRPHPLVRGGHLQTIAGAYVPFQFSSYSATLHETELPDGDRIVLHDDRPLSWRPKDKVSLLIHGLCGSHLSTYMCRIAEKLNSRGVRVFRMDLRGCGAGVHLARLPYHAGRSEDAAAALQMIGQLCPDSPIALIGFSLGANIVLKLLGETSDSPPKNLQTAIAAAPPIDLAACSNNMQSGLNRLYDQNFTRILKRHVKNRQAALPTKPPFQTKAFPKCLFDFDDQVTAPLSGFSSAKEYYARCSSAPLLAKIQLPTLILAAADDPVIPVEMFEKAELADSIRLHITESGGHLGFLGVTGVDPDRRWLDWRIVDWVAPLQTTQSGPHSSVGLPRRRLTLQS